MDTVTLTSGPNPIKQSTAGVRGRGENPGTQLSDKGKEGERYRPHELGETGSKKEQSKATNKGKKAKNRPTKKDVAFMATILQVYVGKLLEERCHKKCGWNRSPKVWGATKGGQELN